MKLSITRHSYYGGDGLDHREWSKEYGTGVTVSGTVTSPYGIVKCQSEDWVCRRDNIRRRHTSYFMTLDRVMYYASEKRARTKRGVAIMARKFARECFHLSQEEA